ncbi:MAG: histone deacetylase family protein [Rhodanobacteraceae bacterium]
MTVLLFSHPACLRHDPGVGHPERPQRLQAVMQGLSKASLPGLIRRDAPRATRQQLERVHTHAHVERVFSFEHLSDRVTLDADTHMSAGSLDAALHAAGACCAAVDAVMSEACRRAFCAVRPPGHHATADSAMGFCLFNSLAVAAAHALAAYGLERIAIADFDVHHGNGTESIFADEPRVLYLSSQQMPLYPGSGSPESQAANACNVPLAPGSGSRQFRTAWRDTLLPALDAFAPQLLLVSAGFDADRRDPLAQIDAGPADYAWITAQLCALADRHAQGRMVSALEGGYDPEALLEDVLVHVRTMLES